MRHSQGGCWNLPPSSFSLIPHLCPQELFIANSQKYARETVLSQRIRDWEDKMEPKLQEQVRPEHGNLSPAVGAGLSAGMSPRGGWSAQQRARSEGGWAPGSGACRVLLK